jgi:putative membrane protein
MNFRINTAATLVAITLLSVPAFAQGLSAEMVDFVNKAAIGNKFEIDSSTLALQKQLSDNTKNFAHMMVADHTFVGDKLKEAIGVAKLDITPPEELDDKHQKTMNELKAATPQAFENMYIRAQIDAHDEAVVLFKSYSDRGDNYELKRFATETLPKLQQHQEKAHSLDQMLVSREK